MLLPQKGMWILKMRMPLKGYSRMASEAMGHLSSYGFLLRTSRHAKREEDPIRPGRIVVLIRGKLPCQIRDPCVFLAVDRQDQANASMKNRKSSARLVLPGHGLVDFECSRYKSCTGTGLGIRTFTECQYIYFDPCLPSTEPPLKGSIGFFEVLLHSPCCSTATSLHAYDPDSAGGRSFHPAGSTPISQWICCFTFMSLGISSHLLVLDDSSSQSPVLYDHCTHSMFGCTHGWREFMRFYWICDEDREDRLSRLVLNSDSDDEVLDENFSLAVKVEPISDLPLLLSVSSESESDDDIEEYIPPIPYGAFKDWEIVRCPLRNTYYHVYYQENRRHRNFFYPDNEFATSCLCGGSPSFTSTDRVEIRTQDEWVVSGWRLYPKSSVHVLDLTNGKTVYMFVDKFYPIRAPLLERMLRHRLTVPPSYCRDVVVAGSCLASALSKKESGSSLQTALVSNSNPLMVMQVLPNLDGDVADHGFCVHRASCDSLDAVVPSLVFAVDVLLLVYFANAGGLLCSCCLQSS
ncbi:hypothetical protein Tco_0362951 [Tanacetum coccineum]